jgi:hypothetical protein
MSNKFLIPLIIVLSLITIGVASLTQLNKTPEKVAMNKSSEIVSSVKTQIVSSSSSAQSQTSSSVISSAQKVVESVKTESQTTIPNTEKCNLPESENLVKTEDGCFRYSIGGRMQGENRVSENEMKFLEQFYLPVAKDYYRKISDKFISNYHILRIDYTSKISENQFEFLIGMDDLEYIKKKYGNAPGDYAEINQARYSVFKNLNNTWSFQFRQFEN